MVADHPDLAHFESDTASARAFGHVLQLLRCSLGLQQDELCRRLGVSSATVSLAERGRRPPKSARLPDWARALEVEEQRLRTVRNITLGFLPDPLPAVPDQPPRGLPQAAPAGTPVDYLAHPGGDGTFDDEWAWFRDVPHEPRRRVRRRDLELEAISSERRLATHLGAAVASLRKSWGPFGVGQESGWYPEDSDDDVRPLVKLTTGELPLRPTVQGSFPRETWIGVPTPEFPPAIRHGRRSATPSGRLIELLETLTPRERDMVRGYVQALMDMRRMPEEER